MATLSDAQRLLWRLITAPEGVAAAIAADADRGGALRSELLRTVRGDATLDAGQRVDIYANMYFFRILDVLKEHYPATHALLGDVTFHNLITDYLLHHPPTHYSIREAGRHLPEFIDQHANGAKHSCAADLARFERALNDAFDAADAPLLTAADLAAVPTEAWPDLRFTLHPSLCLLECGWPVHSLRAAVDRGEPVTDSEPAVTRLCVWRRELTVFHRPLAALEFAALMAIGRGAPFGEACAAAADQVADGDASERVVAALADWLANGWIADLSARS